MSDAQLRLTVIVLAILLIAVGMPYVALVMQVWCPGLFD